MIRIETVKINRYRSIINLEFGVNHSKNITSICGENNVGKTNTLRAINLFFHPEEYDESTDRPMLKYAQGGASVDSKVTLTFFDDEENIYHTLTRDFKEYEFNKKSGLSGEKYKKSKGRVDRSSRKKLSESEIAVYLKKIEFRYIESININIPELIHQLTNDVIDVEYDKARFSNSKASLKAAYEEYTTGLQEILDTFSSSISETFLSFKNNWTINISIPQAADRFRDLISDDVELLINDKGSKNIEGKGSGLQRLAVILLTFEILKRMKGKKNFIVCVDEPDIYLHEGLQRKLKLFFEEDATNIQIFLTTHSKIFIDEYSMDNVILLQAHYYEQYSSRRKRNIDVIATEVVNLQESDGYEKICRHLGIEKNKYNVLKEKNIIVEGECDKKYLSELGKYFGLEAINIISLDGASNAERYLAFYESYYKNNRSEYIPKIKVLFDNDSAGREAYRNIRGKRYSYIEVENVLVNNFKGDGELDPDKNNTNNEIEDLLFPGILCFLANNMLMRKGLNEIETKEIVDKINSPAFSKRGILDLIEHEKNNANPEKGVEISFTSSGQATNSIKKGLAGMFNISGDYEMLKLLKEGDDSYPYVREYLTELFSF